MKSYVLSLVGTWSVIALLHTVYWFEGWGSPESRIIDIQMSEPLHIFVDADSDLDFWFGKVHCDSVRLSYGYTRLNTESQYHLRAIKDLIQSHDSESIFAHNCVVVQ